MVICQRCYTQGKSNDIEFWAEPTLSDQKVLYSPKCKACDFPSSASLRMNPVQLTTVIGARPQFIKASAFSTEVKSREDIRERIVHTGQHYDPQLSQIFFDELEIPQPDAHLGVGSGSHGAVTGEMLRLLEQDFTEHRPHAVLLYGDTNSTLAGALAAAKLHIPVIHVEAGLRSFNRRMPEEINRVLTDHVSEMLFAPTDLAIENLIREGLVDRKIVRTGDIMYDVALRTRARAACSLGVLAELNLSGKPYALATIHRAENTDDPTRLLALLTALNLVAANMRVILPLHPRTKKKIADAGFEDKLNDIQVIEPVGYVDMVRLLSNASVVATDSGGVQKEAYFYRVPCVTLREETEWKELIETGWNRLATGTNANGIAETVLNAVGTAGEPVELYGEGRAAEQIADSIVSYFGAKRFDAG